MGIFFCSRCMQNIPFCLYAERGWKKNQSSYRLIHIQIRKLANSNLITRIFYFVFLSYVLTQLFLCCLAFFLFIGRIFYFINHKIWFFLGTFDRRSLLICVIVVVDRWRRWVSLSTEVVCKHFNNCWWFSSSNYKRSTSTNVDNNFIRSV